MRNEHAAVVDGHTIAICHDRGAELVPPRLSRSGGRQSGNGGAK
ncbi:MAG TPA: hypothetical protein VN494_08275 [Patescibacteria group bacterium]|nr:hypothetical protein [Patescibacteria group bacterium]